MDNLEIIVVVAVGLCVLGGLGRLLSLYAKSRTNPSIPISPRDIDSREAQSSVESTIPCPNSNAASPSQSFTFHGPGQSGSGEPPMDASITFVLPDVHGSWMEFFASPMFGLISEAVFTLSILCIVPCVYLLVKSRIPLVPTLPGTPGAPFGPVLNPPGPMTANQGTANPLAAYLMANPALAMTLASQTALVPVNSVNPANPAVPTSPTTSSTTSPTTSLTTPPSAPLPVNLAVQTTSLLLSSPQSQNNVVLGLLEECKGTHDPELIKDVRELIGLYTTTENIPTLIDALSRRIGVSQLGIAGLHGETCVSVIIPECPRNSKLVGDVKNYGHIGLGGKVEGTHRPPSNDATTPEDLDFIREQRHQKFPENPVS